MLGPDVTDGVAALVSGSVFGVVRSWGSVVVWQRSERLKGVATRRMEQLNKMLHENMMIQSLVQ